MKFIFILAALGLISPVRAACVEWGAFVVSNMGSGRIAIGYEGKDVYANTSIQLQTTRQGDQLNIAENGTYLASFTAWAVAVVGEIVNADMMNNASRLFYRNDGIQANNPFDVAYEEDSFYFAFETSVWKDAEMSGSSQTEYGWVRMSVTDGTLSIADSAIGLCGQAMIVGGGSVPEPSTGMLFTLALAVLALKRRRGMAIRDL